MNVEGHVDIINLHTSALSEEVEPKSAISRLNRICLARNGCNWDFVHRYVLPSNRKTNGRHHKNTVVNDAAVARSALDVPLPVSRNLGRKGFVVVRSHRACSGSGVDCEREHSSIFAHVNLHDIASCQHEIALHVLSCSVSCENDLPIGEVDAVFVE